MKRSPDRRPTTGNSKEMLAKAYRLIVRSLERENHNGTKGLGHDEIACHESNVDGRGESNTAGINDESVGETRIKVGEGYWRY